MIDNFEEQLDEIASYIYACQTGIDDAHRETLRIVEDILERPVKIIL